MKRKPMTFKLGHVYSIEYDDHFSSDRQYRDDIDGEPMRLRQRGVAIKETAKLVIIEHNLHVTDTHATNKRSCHHGILKSAIVKVQHFGPEKM